MEKRGLVNFIFLFAFIIFGLGLVQADSCTVTTVSTCSSSGGHVAMGLSALTNAHAATASVNPYSYVLCCDFSGTTTCDGNNKVLGLYSSTNSHAQVPSYTSYNYDVCYGDLSCTYSTSSSCSSTYPIAMVSLSDTSNAHVAQFSYYGEKICCKHSTATASCGNHILDTGEECDDGNTNSYDGCSNTCQLESGYAVNGTGTCVYPLNPVAYWYTSAGNVNETNIYSGLQITMQVDTITCSESDWAPIDIYKNNYLLGVKVGSTWITAIDGTALDNSIDGNWYVSDSDMAKLTGTSKLFYNVNDPNTRKTLTSYTLTTTATGLCDGVTCDPGYLCNDSTGVCELNCVSHSTYACYSGDVYWYDSCGNMEDLKSDCTSSQTCESGTCVSPTCELTSVSWSTTNATEGDTVTLNAGFSNCDGSTISYEIMEKDGLTNADDAVNVTPASQTIPTGATSISASWTAEYQDDTDGLQSNPPEYYFTATIGSQSLTTSNLLSVEKADTSYCSVNSILSCGDYDKTHCSADTCNVAQDSVGSSDPQCGRGADCSCVWSTTADACVGAKSAWGSCGDGVINTGEQCDGSEWGPITNCTDFGYTGGTLSCDGCVFDTSQCTGKTAGDCGDGVINTGEQCDETSLAFSSCTNFDSFTSGTLICNEYCILDTNVCLGGVTGIESDGSCSYIDNADDDCEDSVLQQEIIAEWTGTTMQPSWCYSYNETLVCPAQIKVPFFGALQLIVAVILLAIIYYLLKSNISKKKKHNKKRK